MIATVAAFELSRRLRLVSTYVYVGVFFGLSALFVAVAGGAIGGATIEFGTGAKVYINSPYSLAFLLSLAGHFGLVITAAVTGRAVYQDFEHRCDPLFLTKPVTTRAYLAGRLLGAFAFLAALYLAIGLGAFAATSLVGVDPSRLGPQRALAYALPYLTLLLPNLFSTGALFFCVATLGRRMLPVYVAAVVLIVGYLVSLDLSNLVERKALIALADPFGLLALDRVTEYWTPAERNVRLIPLAGPLLLNRALWVGVGAALLALTFARFRRGPAPQASRPAEPADSVAVANPAGSLPPLRPDVSARASAARWADLVRVQALEALRGRSFLVIVLAGVLFVFASTYDLNALYGTSTQPVTYLVLEGVGGAFSLFALAVTTFYAGELVWRERDAGMGQVYDALPLPSRAFFTAKLASLLALQVVLVVVMAVCSVVLQACKGYFHFEPALYVKTLFGLRLFDLWLAAAIATFVHVAANNKYAGHALMVLYYAATLFLPALGLEHYLYRVGQSPRAIYSDMNGFGHFAAPALWFRLYWGLFALALALASNALWPRGTDTRPRARLRAARRRLRPPLALAFFASSALFVVAGAHIYWNTNVLNRYRSRRSLEADAALYERRYKRFEAAPQPRVTSVRVDVDLHPQERRAALSGALGLHNRSGLPVASLALTLPPEAKVRALRAPGGRPAEIFDAALGFYVYPLDPPLGPGESAELGFDLVYEHPGFSVPRRDDRIADNRIVENGTFFDSEFLPFVGYRRATELAADDQRRRQGLPFRERTADLNDSAARWRNYVSPDGDWVDFEATIATDPDQIALAPGYLERDWLEGGRRRFRYKMDAKTFNFHAFASARYAVYRDAWRGVPIEIYHHPSHAYNLGRMADSVKASLDYFGENFGPYQHRQVRILEFPRYELFAQSFANTIPYSESIGFIARVDDTKPDEIDYPFYVTAHEVAHQWWGHQVVGADAQGATLLSETLSQYSALMVMKARFGPAAMKKFLRYELDRYLRGRGNEKKKELPLVRVEDQAYVHYSKGSLAMYALQDYVGEATVNRALAAFVREYAFRGPPYPVSTDLVAALRRETPPEWHYLFEDLFETITLYENRALSAVATKRSDGRYDVRLRAGAKKLRAGELGDEREVPIDDPIDVGVLDGAGSYLYLQRHRVNSPELDLTLTVEGRPAKAGIDPLNKLIDRMPDDNLVAVDAP